MCRSPTSQWRRCWVHHARLLTLVHLLRLTLSAREVNGKITVYPITTVNVASHTNYFADPYPIQHTGEGVWIAGTTHGYLKCDSALEPNYAVNYTVLVRSSSANRRRPSQSDAVGSTSNLICHKNYMTHPARDGVAACPLDNPSPIKAGSSPTFLLESDDGLISQYFKTGNSGSMVSGTGSIRAIQGKFLITYSTGSYNRDTYKARLAWSDTFLPRKPGVTWRKVTKNKPDHLYNSTGVKESLYLVQFDMNVAGWNYVGGQ
jgi:hypothetical protein